ncbi:unnamed protein product [Rhizophagus irregularis]|nr:unnamed protein product [Rhizophagus irregularis]
MEEGDFDRVDFQRTEKGELRSWMSRVSSEEWKKLRFVLGGLLKNRKLKDSSQMGFRRTEKGEPLLRFISDGLLNNGKELRFIWVGFQRTERRNQDSSQVGF